MPTRGWVVSALRLLVPLGAALTLIYTEPYLTRFAASHQGVLPLAMFSLVGAILVTRVRRWLIVTLCFGVALLALRDAAGPVRLPAELDYDYGAILGPLSPVIWGLVALLAGAAGAVEALRPGTVLARRCYFGTAALYLAGHGALGLLARVDVASAVLLVTGIASGVGVFTAGQIVAREEDEAPLEPDIAAMRESQRQRAEALASREWKDAAEKLSKSL
ncbi:MAG: hypothetical protein IT208_06890 [Chthonomonadales bacterium]|nr:hypothetical protein [Chthonomonadales bacterium]